MNAQQKRDRIITLTAGAHAVLAEITHGALMGDAISAKGMSGEYQQLVTMFAALGVAVQDYRITVEAGERAEDAA